PDSSSPSAIRVRPNGLRQEEGIPAWKPDVDSGAFQQVPDARSATWPDGRRKRSDQPRRQRRSTTTPSPFNLTSEFAIGSPNGYDPASSPPVPATIWTIPSGAGLPSGSCGAKRS